MAPAFLVKNVDPAPFFMPISILTYCLTMRIGGEGRHIHIFLQNVGWLSVNYKVLYPRRQNSLLWNCSSQAYVLMERWMGCGTVWPCRSAPSHKAVLFTGSNVKNFNSTYSSWLKTDRSYMAQKSWICRQQMENLPWCQIVVPLRFKTKVCISSKNTIFLVCNTCISKLVQAVMLLTCYSGGQKFKSSKRLIRKLANAHVHSPLYHQHTCRYNLNFLEKESFWKEKIMLADFMDVLY
jgi:hypothetical protein